MVSNAYGEKKGLLVRLSGGKKTKPAIILVAALAGVALLLFGGMSGGSRHETVSTVSEDLDRYAESVEAKIYELCSRVEGVSNVSVAVSLECGYEYVYAREDDAGKYLVVGSGSSENAVRVTEKTPIIGGIGIVCRGGGNPAIQNKLINLISAAFGVGSNKIYITEAAK